MDEHAIRKILEGGGGWPGRMLRTGLWIPGVCYGGLMKLRRAAYRRGWFEARRAPVPVVSVGNLTAGGSGKTPFVAFLARRLAAAGHRPGILLRGYRAAADGVSDEAVLYGELCPGVPVEVGPDRFASAGRAVEAGADVLILDDGFQHLRLERDLDIVLIDATSPWGGGNTFPGGLLREPKSALRRAGAVVVTRADQVEPAAAQALKREAAALAPGAGIFFARHRPSRLNRMDGNALPLEMLRGRRVLVLAGIARPEAFARTLRDMGAEVVGTMGVRDHGRFDDAFIARALTRARKEDLRILVTEKDRARGIFSVQADNPVDNSNVWSLGIELEMEGEGELLELALRILSDSKDGFCDSL